MSNEDSAEKKEMSRTFREWLDISAQVTSGELEPGAETDAYEAHVEASRAYYRSLGEK